MLVTLGCRWCKFLEPIKYRTLYHRIYVNCAKSKRNSRNLCKIFYISPSYVVINRLVSPLISGVTCDVNYKTQCIFPESTSASSKGIIGYLWWVVSSTWDFIQVVVRYTQFTCTFMPLLLLYPLTATSSYFKSMWYKMLLIGIEFSGPIIIKLGQWASTRRDLFSEELCINLSKLQRRTVPHSWYYTKKCFESAYGPQWNDIFVKIDNNGNPIGSGCCAQVYKAWIRKEKIPLAVSSDSVSHRTSNNSLLVEALELIGVGHFSRFSKAEPRDKMDDLQPVAVKVRHPQIERRLRQDLLVLKFLANTVTWLIPSFKWLSLCECVDEFSQVMKNQVDFCIEARNLELFSLNFKNLKTVKFPHPLWSLTRPNILVETFEEGCNIDEFVDDRTSVYSRKCLASMGVNTILKMVFQDNFIHGDLHPGNVLVQEKHIHENAQKLPVFQWGKHATHPFTLVIVDCGIVATLDERGKRCLKDVFTAVVNSDGERVAELFLEHSNHECNDVLSFKNQMREIVQNALSKSVTLQQVDVSVLMNSLFSTMINHRVKLDSSFSSVILAIMVLEGLGRSLDPTIDIVESAKPFLVDAM